MFSHYSAIYEKTEDKCGCLWVVYKLHHCENQFSKPSRRFIN